MSDLPHSEIYRHAIATYGEDAQIVQALGEMGELAAAIARYQQPGRGEEKKYLRNRVIDELADVFIMITQLRMIYDCDDDDQLFWMFVNAKTERLAERMGL